MAVVKIVPAYIPLGTGAAMPALAAITSAEDGAAVPFEARDTNLAVLVKNTGSLEQTVTFKQGGGVQAAADLAEVIPAGETRLFVVESGRYRQISGEQKGCVVLTGPTSLQVGAVVLP